MFWYRIITCSSRSCRLCSWRKPRACISSWIARPLFSHPEPSDSCCLPPRFPTWDQHLWKRGIHVNSLLHPSCNRTSAFRYSYFCLKEGKTLTKEIGGYRQSFSDKKSANLLVLLARAISKRFLRVSYRWRSATCFSFYGRYRKKTKQWEKKQTGRSFLREPGEDIDYTGSVIERSTTVSLICVGFFCNLQGDKTVNLLLK